MHVGLHVTVRYRKVIRTGIWKHILEKDSNFKISMNIFFSGGGGSKDRHKEADALI
jgi:hypothetical protein